MIEIKRWTDGKVLYTAENAQDVRSAVEEAVKASADLRYADLRSANLRYADLGYANLRSADLGYANLRSANLRYADLGYANLRSADLRYANLRWNHPLWIFRQDFFSILDQAPGEVATLREKIVAGEIEGSTYEGPCSCLAGTIATAHGCSVDNLDDELGIETNASRPAEQWFIIITKGDKPISLNEGMEFESEGVFRISVALLWLDQWIESRMKIGAILSGAVA